MSSQKGWTLIDEDEGLWLYFKRCECGGRVLGQWAFGRMWSWCEECTSE